MKKKSWVWLTTLPLLGAVVSFLMRPIGAVPNSQSVFWGDTTPEKLTALCILVLLLAMLYGFVGAGSYMRMNTVPEVVICGMGIMFGGSVGNLLQLVLYDSVSDFYPIAIGSSVALASVGDVLLLTGFLMAIFGSIGYLIFGRERKIPA